MKKILWVALPFVILWLGSFVIANTVTKDPLGAWFSIPIMITFFAVFVSSIVIAITKAVKND